jgi:CBS domain-containing protein
LFAWLVVTDTFSPLAELSVAQGSFLERLMVVNVGLVLFNLLPAFPMDGGRVLRAGLALKMDYAKATSAAAKLGQGFAVVFGIIGLFTNPFLVLIAVFIWFGAASESMMAQTQSKLAGVPVERAMRTQFDMLSPLNSLGYVSNLAMAGSQQEFPVVEEGRPIGLVTRADLYTALAQYGPLGRVSQAMRRNFATVEASDPLPLTAEKLQTGQVRSMLVLRGGQLAGLLTLDSVREFALIQAALEKNAGSDKIELIRTT